MPSGNPTKNPGQASSLTGVFFAARANGQLPQPTPLWALSAQALTPPPMPALFFILNSVYSLFRSFARDGESQTAPVDHSAGKIGRLFKTRIFQDRYRA